jgi:hypothetical protein
MDIMCIPLRVPTLVQKRINLKEYLFQPELAYV